MGNPLPPPHLLVLVHVQTRTSSSVTTAAGVEMVPPSVTSGQETVLSWSTLRWCAVVAGWFHAVRGFEVLCIIGLTSACIYALITNFCLSFPGPRSRDLEITAGVSGILGFIGCMVFVGKYDTLNKDYDWAFYFATVGSDLVVIAAIVIGVNNKPMPNRGLMVTTTATAQPQPYTVQPGNYPPQSYVAQPGNYPPPRSVDQPGNYPPPHSVDQPGNYPPPHSVDQPGNYPPPHSVDQPSNYPPPHSVDQP
ncbi:uncharacterized protein LOC143300459 isoform X2 [Babylonia areolata]|uniref:uncharacterized protein LOC143300459 isoform X2 n=1 Tax=Babylonia areolata TaxID=304850 RepID=UPI003FD649FF